MREWLTMDGPRPKVEYVESHNRALGRSISVAKPQLFGLSSPKRSPPYKVRCIYHRWSRIVRMRHGQAQLNMSATKVRRLIVFLHSELLVDLCMVRGR